MSSRSFISILISLTALAVGWIYLILGPDFSTERNLRVGGEGESLPITASLSEKKEQRVFRPLKPSAKGRARVPRPQESPQSGVLDPHFERLFNQISQSARDDRILERLGKTPESKLIRFAIALALGQLQSPLADSEKIEIQSQIDQSIRNGRVELFQGFEVLAVEAGGSAQDQEQARVVRSILSQAAVDNPYAQMMVQDLIVREFYRDSSQDFGKVAARYGIGPDHPLYGRIEKAFNRQPASQ
jgi:hypothetical protein